MASRAWKNTQISIAVENSDHLNLIFFFQLQPEVDTSHKKLLFFLVLKDNMVLKRCVLDKSHRAPRFCFPLQN